MACSKAFIRQAVSQWSGIPVTQLSDDTELDGLGGKSWPDNGQDLIDIICAECECIIAPSVYETFTRISDIDDFLEAEGLLDED